MKTLKSLSVILLAAAALGLAACTQASPGDMSGSALSDEATPEVVPEGQPGPLATIHYEPGATEEQPGVAPEGDPGAAPTAEIVPPAPVDPAVDAGEPLMPPGYVAPADPKSDGADGAPAADGASDADPASGGAADGLAQGDPDLFVAAHNLWRSKPSYNTPALAWDATVAAYAQEWATYLATNNKFEHRSNGQYGENMFIGSAAPYAPSVIVDSWGSEEEFWDKTCTGDFDQCCQGGWMKCGHFTAVIWNTTTKVGCGKALNSAGHEITVCNYDPPGNYTGRRPYPAPVAAATATPAAAQQTKGSGYGKTFNLPIPDAGSPVEGTYNVTASGTLQNIQIRVVITHPYIGDLIVKLVHPDGTTVTLHNGTGGETDNLIAWYAYGKDGIPVADLARFVGKPVTGAWKVRVQDIAAEDSGTLGGGTLNVFYTTP